MFEVSDITSVDGLRKTTFSDLFYKVYGRNIEGADIAEDIVNAVDPGLFPLFMEQREEALLLNYVKKVIKSKREERVSQVKSLREEYKQLFGRKYKAASLDMEGAFASYLKKQTQIKDTASIITPIGFLDYFIDDFLMKENDGIEGVLARIQTMIDDNVYFPDAMAALVADKSACQSMLLAIEDGIASRLQGRGNRVLTCLLFLPFLQSDQDLIIFFGRNYQKSFNDVDAYVGLLYAFDFFSTDGRHLLLDISDEEMREFIEKRRGKQ